MADPLSVTASIIAVLQLSGNVVTLLTTAYKAPEERKRLITEIAFSTGILLNLKELAERDQSSDNWALAIQALSIPRGPIAQFKSSLEDLYKRLTPKSGKSLRWPFAKVEVMEIMSTLERQKSSFLMILELDHIRLSKELKNDFSGIKEYMGLMNKTIDSVNNDRNEREFLQIMDWLSPLTFSEKQNDNFERRQDGTGEWFLQSEEFKDWLGKSSGCIWCPGPPGAGKTTMASIVINHLEGFCMENDATIAYLYFKYEEVENQSISNMLGSLLRQLLQRKGTASDQVMSLYKDHSTRKTRLKPTEIVKLLQSEFLSSQRTFIIIDALDEYWVQNDDKAIFIDELHKFSTTTSLMMTSRPDMAIRSKFEDAMEIEIEATGSDVAKYVEKCLREDTRLKKHVEGDAALRDTIITSIVQNSQGLFLLPQLHLEALGAKKKKRDLKVALENLTQDLGPIYDSAKKRILAQNTEDIIIAKQVLSWILYASRPLQVEEIRHALAVEPLQKVFDEECLITEEDIVSVCAGLVTVDRYGNVMRFIHQTVHEYLLSVQSELFPNAQYYIATTCLTYLSFDIFSTEEQMNYVSIERLNSAYPFLLYAARYWGNHAIRCTGSDPLVMVLDFLEKAPKLVYYVMHHLIYRYGASGGRTVAGAPKLQVAASFGLEEAARTLLKQGEDVEARSSDGWTALSSAAWNGQEAIVELLLESGANVQAKNNAGWNALACACRNGHLSIIRKLVARGADIETRTNSGWTPLLSAAWHGHEAVILLLLELGAEIEANNDRGWTPLHQVAGHGDYDLVNLLLEHGASVHARSDWGWTPLMGAVSAKVGDPLQTVLVLLDAGSEKDAKDNRQETAYDKAVYYGKRELLDLLR